MSAKVVWVAMGLMVLLWVGGVGERWLVGTPKLRLSVAPGGPGGVRGEHRLEVCLHRARGGMQTLCPYVPIRAQVQYHTGLATLGNGERGHTLCLCVPTRGRNPLGRALVPEAVCYPFCPPPAVPLPSPEPFTKPSVGRALTAAILSAPLTCA